MSKRILNAAATILLIGALVASLLLMMGSYHIYKKALVISQAMESICGNIKQADGIFSKYLKK